MEQKPPKSLLTLVGKVTSSNEICRVVRLIGTGFFFPDLFLRCMDDW
jgi:hypothetical protein